MGKEMFTFKRKKKPYKSLKKSTMYDKEITHSRSLLTIADPFYSGEIIKNTATLYCLFFAEISMLDPPTKIRALMFK